MLTVEFHEGEYYHYDSDEDKFILDESGNLIPSSECLCFAKYPSECCCGCTSWTVDDYE